MAAGEFTPATVRTVFFDRDGSACFLCRRHLRFEDRGIGWSMHHRKPRGAGAQVSAGPRRSRRRPTPSPSAVLGPPGATGTRRRTGMWPCSGGSDLPPRPGFRVRPGPGAGAEERQDVVAADRGRSRRGSGRSRSMSVKVSSWVWHGDECAELNGNELILMLALADVAGTKVGAGTWTTSRT